MFLTRLGLGGFFVVWVLLPLVAGLMCLTFWRDGVGWPLSVGGAAQGDKLLPWRRTVDRVDGDGERSQGGP